VPSHFEESKVQYFGFESAEFKVFVFSISWLPISIWIWVEVAALFASSAKLCKIMMRAAFILFVAPASLSMTTTRSVADAGGVKDDDLTSFGEVAEVS
jgi:hypothetical protein